MITTITGNELAKLSSEAAKSIRKRKNLNYHSQPTDTLQRMLHAMQKGTYVQPHKHENPDKREVFIILEGRVAVVEYDEIGNVINHTVLDRQQQIYGAEIAPRTWHSLIALEDNTVVYEIKDGPYNPIDDKDFAKWAPKEGEEGCKAFIQKVLKDINVKI